MTVGLDSIVSTATGLVFLFAAVAKLRNRSLFVASLREYVAVPRPAVAPLAWIIPGVELLVGGLAVVAPTSSVVHWLMVLLLIAFSTVVSVNVIAGRIDVPCGCFGQHSVTLSIWTALRPLLLVVVLLGTSLIGASSSVDGTVLLRLVFAGGAVVCWVVVDRIAVRVVSLRRAYREFLTVRGEAV